MSALPPGYTVPVHRSLTEPVMMAGAPRAVTILNGTIAAAIGLGLQLWLAGGVFWIVMQSAAVYAARKDPKFLEVLLRHIRHRSFLGA